MNKCPHAANAKILCNNDLVLLIQKRWQAHAAAMFNNGNV